MKRSWQNGGAFGPGVDNDSASPATPDVESLEAEALEFAAPPPFTIWLGYSAEEIRKALQGAGAYAPTLSLVTLLSALLRPGWFQRHIGAGFMATGSHRVGRATSSEFGKKALALGWLHSGAALGLRQFDGREALV